jgi:hypothetical protein
MGKQDAVGTEFAAAAADGFLCESRLALKTEL